MRAVAAGGASQAESSEKSPWSVSPERHAQGSRLAALLRPVYTPRVELRRPVDDKGKGGRPLISRSARDRSPDSQTHSSFFFLYGDRGMSRFAALSLSLGLVLGLFVSIAP